jgi:TRAP transporter 4TM/12TM fusion protein
VEGGLPPLNGARDGAAGEVLRRYRTLRGYARWIEFVLATGLPVVGVLFILSVHSHLGFELFAEQYFGLFLAVILGLVFIKVPATRRASRTHVAWYDWILAAGGLAVGAFIAVKWPELVLMVAYITAPQLALGVLALVLILEAIRRAIGWSVVLLVAFFILYARFTWLFPGFLHSRGVPWDQLVNYLYLDTSALLSMVRIGATIGLAFILLGQVLLVFGASQFFTEVAFALMGRFRGGPAKAAVFGSSLMGTISGGPVTNVMLTGPVTIPMMIRTGYPRHVAAAIEALASSGGQIMPPVMGVAAFLMADFLQIRYAEVVRAAVIPALLYYVAIFIQVDLEAAKNGIKGSPAAELPKALPALAKGWIFLAPLGLLLYTLFVMGMPAATAGVVSALLSLVAMLLVRENRRQLFRRLLETLEGTTRILLDISVILAGAGLLVGAMSISGLSSSLAFALVEVAGDNLFLLLVLAAIVSVILGMGMPSVAAYVIVVLLVAPALEEMGVLPLAAHMFVFYFAIVSNFTPPVAVAAFAAGAIAETNPLRAGLTATRMGVIAYVLPFLFVLQPSLIGRAPVWEVVLATATAAVGALLLGIALIGHAFRSVSALVRLLLFLAAAALLLPHGVVVNNAVGWIIEIAGTALALVVLSIEWRHARLARRAVSPSAQRQRT